MPITGPAPLIPSSWSLDPAGDMDLLLGRGFAAMPHCASDDHRYLTLDQAPEFRICPKPGGAMDSMGIEALAHRAGVLIDTVRYYERDGLLALRSRLASGYRRYGATELSRLRFIRRAQSLGFTLKEIEELLGISSRRDVARVKAAAQRKLADVERR